MDSFLQDLRYAFRMLVKSPGFTAVAILTLALGIGANTAVFTIVNAVLLRPLPFSHPEQLVKIWGRYSTQGIPQNWISEPEWWDMRDGLHSFSALAAYNAGGGANMTRAANDPLRVTTNAASADLFPLLGVAPAKGRLFTADDDQPGHDRVVLLDYGFWTSQMASDPGVLGRSIELNGESNTVIGVLPKGFTFGGDANLWVPLALDRARPQDRGSHYLEVIGRLKPGVTMAQATADLEAFVGRMSAQYPRNYGGKSGFGMFLRPLHEELVGDTRLGLLVVFAAVAFVLLIACINLANLLLARGSARRRELAVRAALGAGRARLVRQLVTESVAMAAIGGLCGILLAIWATQFLQTAAVATLPNTGPIRLDIPVLLFAAGLSILTGILFGVAPALQMSGSRTIDALKDATRGSTTSSGHNLRRSLVVAEISIALVLLVAAGLMVRSLQRLLDVNPGFQPEHLLTSRISLPQAHYRDANATSAFYRQLSERVQSVPGVQAAGLASILPMSGRHSSGSTYVEQTSVEGLMIADWAHKPYIEADRRYVTPGFFEALKMPLVRGRFFNGSDNADAPLVAIVDEDFARRFWPDRDAIGQRIATGPIPNVNPLTPQWRTVVGVVGHVKNDSLDQQGREQTYLPVYQVPFPFGSMYFAVRGAGNPNAFAGAIQREVRALDPTLPVYEVKTMDELLDESVSPRRFNMMLLVVFGALALTLASVGTYGVIAYSVGQRTQEIGIRMALGASRRDVLRMVVSSGLRLSIAGVVIGVVLALFATRLLSTLLFGVRSTDPLTFAGVAIVLMAAALLATYVPARRATRVDPMVALRYE